MVWQRIKTKQAATGVALFLSPWVDDLLRLLGAVGDVRDVGALVLGMPPEFLFLLLQWLVATTGLVLVSISVAEPIVARIRRWRGSRARRGRLREMFPWISGESYEIFKHLAAKGEGAFKGVPEPPIREFLVEVGQIGGINHSHPYLYRLDPTLRDLAKKLVEERETKAQS